MEGSSSWETLLVLSFGISDEDEGVHEADNPRSFEQTSALLEKLRAENPTLGYAMFAVIDA
jgi:hypothetical protein